MRYDEIIHFISHMIMMHVLYLAFKICTLTLLSLRRHPQIHAIEKCWLSPLQ
jgi:hypothetical protein